MDINQKLTISLPQGKAEEQGVLELISRSDFVNNTFFIFSSTNFFGHRVTVGTRVVQGNDDTIRVYVKTARCSEDDNFNKATGEEIVIGRLVKADAQEPTFAMFTGTLSDEEKSRSVHEAIKSVITGYAEVLVKRDRIFGELRLAESLGKSVLQKSFARYK